MYRLATKRTEKRRRRERDYSRRKRPQFIAYSHRKRRLPL